jgi:hypothetical protein
MVKDEIFETWFEKNQAELEKNYLIDNYDYFRDYAKGEYEVNKESYME